MPSTTRGFGAAIKISDLLSPTAVVVDLRASNKRQLLEELAARAAAGSGLSADRVAATLLRREELGSTGIGRGVAIPHARLPGLRRPCGVLARLQPPIEFEAIDRQKVDIVFVLLLPAAAETEALGAGVGGADIAIAGKSRTPARGEDGGRAVRCDGLISARSDRGTIGICENYFLATRRSFMARKYSKKASAKVGRAMKKRKAGTLKSGRSGRKVKSRKQAIAIGLSEARRSGAKVPKKKKSKKTKKSKKSKKRSSK